MRVSSKIICAYVSDVTYEQVCTEFHAVLAMIVRRKMYLNHSYPQLHK
jgi:hypothetical protein